MFSFNVILTEKCNARCSHCYMSAGVSKKSLSKEQIDLFLSKIPVNTKTIVYTGGEVLLEKELLHYAIKESKRVCPDAQIGVETNGIVLYNNLQKAVEELEFLKEIGVDFVRFSDDEFHAQGGVNLEKVRELKKLESEKTPTIKFLVQETALAIGKAKDLPEEKQAVMNCMNNDSSVQNPYLFLDIDGGVHICTWKCAPAVGNIFENDFQTVLSKLEDEFFKLILSGKIEDAVDMVQPESKEANRAYAKSKGQCMLCNKIFKGE